MQNNEKIAAVGQFYVFISKFVCILLKAKQKHRQRQHKLPHVILDVIMLPPFASFQLMPLFHTLRHVRIFCPVQLEAAC